MRNDNEVVLELFCLGTRGEGDPCDVGTRRGSLSDDLKRAMRKA